MSYFKATIHKNLFPQNPTGGSL